MLAYNKKKIILDHPNGTVEGVYYTAGNFAPLVIIVNGHNGFYNYGMFPFMQEKLFESGISSFSFNFSHGGITGDNDYFDDLEKYEKNCMRLETEDLLCVFDNLPHRFDKYSKLILLAHSLGGVPLLFGAKEALGRKVNIAGIILISAVKTLNFWPAGMLKEWAFAGVFYKKNNRTGQDLPQGFEFLQEIIHSETSWNVGQAIKSLQVPVLIIHGDCDESVPMEHGRSLFEWSRSVNPRAEFRPVPNATHTYNTKHPFEGPSAELIVMLETVTRWINRVPL